MAEIRLPLPLEGVRVLDLGVGLAGMLGSQMLADLGAEVIRVEPSQRPAPGTRDRRRTVEEVGEATPIGGSRADREPDERPWSRFAPFDATARNKLGMTVDLRQPEGRDILRRLVALSDVLIIDVAAGPMSEFGIGYEALAEVNQRLIYVAATAGSCAGASAIALAAEFGLYARDKTGVGQYVDVSLTENLLGLIGATVLDYTVNGRVDESIGNRDSTALQGSYPCAGDDRWLVLTIADDRGWAGLARSLGEPGWMSEVRFATVHERCHQRDEIDERIAAWTRAIDRDDAVARLRAEGVTAGPVLNDADAGTDPHLAERGYFVELTHDDSGTYSYPGMPYRFARAPLSVRRWPVRLGEDNRDIYRELLGVGEDEYRRLEAAGHIGTAHAPDIR